MRSLSLSRHHDACDYLQLCKITCETHHSHHQVPRNRAHSAGLHAQWRARRAARCVQRKYSTEAMPQQPDSMVPLAEEHDPGAVGYSLLRHGRLCHMRQRDAIASIEAGHASVGIWPAGTRWMRTSHWWQPGLTSGEQSGSRMTHVWCAVESSGSVVRAGKWRNQYRERGAVLA